MKIIMFLLCLGLVLGAKPLVFSGAKGSVGQHIAAKIIQKAYDRAGIDVAFVWEEAQDSLVASNKGLNDGQISRMEAISNQFSNLIKVPVSTLTIEAVAFSKNSELFIESWSDLSGKDFMVVRGVKFIEYATKNYNKRYAKSFDEAMQQLHDGKVDIVVAPKIVGLYTIFDKGFKDISVVSLALKSIDLFHFVHKKHKVLVSKITPFLKDMKKHSEMRAIRENHLISKLHNRTKQK